MDAQLAEVRRMHRERAEKQRLQEKEEANNPSKPAPKKGKVIGGKYFANPPKQIGMKEYEELINKYQRIQVQKGSHLKRFDLDEDAASFFQSFLRRMDFGLMRAAIMYGTVNDGVVSCHCCYEPEQIGSPRGYKFTEDKLLPKVDNIAKLLGYQRVGMLVSYLSTSPDDPILTASEVILAAEQQALYGSHCCLIQMRVLLEGGVNSHDAAAEFDAYQASHQGTEIWKEGILSPHPEDPKLVCSEREMEAVQKQATGAKMGMVSKEPTRSVDSVLFTVNVPITSFKAPIGNRFIRISRPGEAPPDWSNVRLFLSSEDRKAKPFVEQVADFHLLVFLAAKCFEDLDMKHLIQAILSKDHVAIEGFETLIKSGCGML